MRFVRAFDPIFGLPARAGQLLDNLIEPARNVQIAVWPQGDSFANFKFVGHRFSAIGHGTTWRSASIR